MLLSVGGNLSHLASESVLVACAQVNRLVQRSGQASIIVLLLAAVMGAGAFFTAAFAGRHALMDLIQRQNIGFHALC